MLTAPTQVQFAAEFLGVLVAGFGLALLAVKPSPPPVMAAGWVVLGGVAFVRGALLVPGHLGPARLAGALLVGAGAVRWPPDRSSRVVLGAGLAVVAAAGVLEILVSGKLAVAAVLIVANLLLAAGLADGARRSIAARVAASAAVTLLVVVMVVSVALSSAITGQTRRDQRAAVASLAHADGEQLAESTRVDLASVVALTGAIERSFPAAARRTALPNGSPGARALGALLRALPPGPSHGVAGYLPAAGPLLGPAAAVAGLAPAVAPARCGSARAVLAPVAGRLMAVAADPVCRAGSSVPYGSVVLAQPLAAASLVPGPGTRVVVRAGGRALLRAGRPGPGGTLAARQPVAPGITLTVTESRSLVARTERSLEETLFLVALGGAVLALGLAALTGDRITAGLRRLTRAAERIQGGDFAARAGSLAVDEVGTLAAAFDAMVSAVEEKAVALRDAADDEVRLRSRLEAVVAGMADALVAVDAGGRVAAFNPAAERLLGRVAGDVLGRDVAEALGGVPGGPVGEVTTAAGETIPVAVTVGPLHGPLGEASGIVVLLRDLRPEREVERMKSEFLSRVGHELRTPLSGVVGYTELLLARDVPAEQARQWYEEILAAARRQLRVVALLEFFASSGAGRPVLDRRPVDPGALVATVAAEWEARLDADHRLVARVARGLPAMDADPRWLATALDELIGNAAKFSPAGGTVTVGASRAALGDGRSAVELFVRDEGPGMSVEERRRAFSEFAQGDSSDTRRFGGLGLGLALVRRVAEGHGGEVGCRSSKGRGTRIALRIPAAPAAAVVEAGAGAAG